MHIYLALSLLMAALTSCNDDSPIKPDSKLEHGLEDITEELLKESFGIDVEIDISPEEKDGN